MFKKILSVATIVGMAFVGNASVASAKSGNHYQNNQGYSKHQNKGHHNKGHKKHWGHGPKKHWGNGYAYGYGVPISVIRHKLRHRGYRKIRFYDRYLPVYKARVCKHGKRYKLRINRWGKVMGRKRIGWCGGHHYRHHKYRNAY